MQQKTSYFNKTLYLKNLKNFWPVYTVLTLCGLMIPVIQIVPLIFDKSLGSVNGELFTEIYCSILTTLVPLLSFFYACVVAMGTWSYLFRARDVNFFHSLPIKREGLFVTDFLSAYTIMLIPYALPAILMTGLSIGTHSFTGTITLELILVILGESFFFLSLATFTAHLCGNLVSVPIIYVALNFMEVIGEALIESLLSGFIRGVSFNFTGRGEILSPLPYLLMKVAASNTYRAGEDGQLVMNEASAHVDNLYLILIYVLAGLVLAGISLLIYKKRNSEAAGEVVAFKPVKDIFVIVAAAFMGIGCGLILEAATPGSSTYNLPRTTFFILGSGTVAYFVLLMLVNKTLKVFKKSVIPGLLGLLAFFFLTCLTIGLDLFNVEGYVPESKDIDYVEVSLNGNTFIFSPNDEKELEEFLSVHKYIIKNLDNGDYGLNEYEGSYCNINIYYYLTNGSTVSRDYDFNLADLDSKSTDSFPMQLNAFFTTPARLKQLMHTDGDYKLSDVYVDITTDYGDYSDGESSYAEGDEELKALYEAVIKDIDAGNWNPLLVSAYAGDEDDIYLNFEFQKVVDKKLNTTITDWEYTSVYVTDSMAYTLKALKDYNYLSE